MSGTADRAGEGAKAKPEGRRRPGHEVALEKAFDLGCGFLVRNNAFYLLSALLMLVGCMLIGIPIPFEFREMWIIAVLVGVINVYEAMVILAASYIARRRPESREVSFLLVIETVFLLDGHFTVNAGLTTSFAWGLPLAVAALVLAFVKIRALERGTRSAVFGGMKAFLVPAIVFMHAVQVVLILARSASPGVREVSTYLAWLALAALPMLLLATKLGRAGEGDSEAERGSPWWRGRGFALAVAVMGLVIPAVLLAGQTWAHRAPFAASFPLPFAFALMAAAPVIVRIGRRRQFAVNRAIVAFFLIALAAARDGDIEWAVRLGGASLALSPLRVDLVFGAFAFLVMWRRERIGVNYHVAFAMLALAVTGHDGESIARFLAKPGLARTAAFVPVAFAWWLRGRGYARALGAMTALLFTAARAAGLARPETCPVLEFVRWWPVAALALALVLRPRDAFLRAALAAAAFASGVWSAAAPDAAGNAVPVAAFCALAGAAVAGGRRHALLAAVYVVAANLASARPPLPATSLGWGSAAITLAFAAFGAAFLVTRLGLSRVPDAEAAGGGGRPASPVDGPAPGA